MRFLIGILVFVQMSIAQQITPHYFKERVVTIHADSSQRVLAQKQLAAFLLLEKEMIDRKIVLYDCLESQCVFYDFFENPKTIKISPTNASFEIRLYGLDGQLKYEANQFVTPQELFTLIDKMPMRRNEMRKRIKKEGYE